MNLQVVRQKLKENMSIVIVIGLGVLLILGGLIYSHLTRPLNVSQFMEKRDLKECNIQKETVVVDGSGNDLYPAGTELEVEMNYYNCNPGQRNEVAMIASPGRPNPIFKYVKMIPGDKFKIQPHKEKFHLEINGDVMENLDGQAYEFIERKSRMVKLYESNYQDGIRDGVYFVFGSTLSGGFDSTRFGPITNERMIGRVIAVKRQPSATESKPSTDPVAKPAPVSTHKVSPPPAPAITQPAVAPVPPPAKPPQKPAVAAPQKTSKPEKLPAPKNQKPDTQKPDAHAPKKQ